MTTDKMVNVDQLEVSPDGAWLFFQPIGGPLARGKTSLIENPSVSQEVLSNRVEKLNDTWTVNTRSVMTIAADGNVATLISDPRLRWIDTMWIDKDGFLYMPAAHIWKMQIGRKPAPNDHR